MRRKSDPQRLEFIYSVIDQRMRQVRVKRYAVGFAQQELLPINRQDRRTFQDISHFHSFMTAAAQTEAFAGHDLQELELSGKIRLHRNGQLLEKDSLMPAGKPLSLPLHPDGRIRRNAPEKFGDIESQRAANGAQRIDRRGHDASLNLAQHAYRDPRLPCNISLVPLHFFTIPLYYRADEGDH